MGEDLLLVLCVLDGRYFTPQQRDPGLKVYVEAKLGNDTLITDQVTLTSTPKFDSELAFELKKKGLQLHRINRTPLKVQCVIINSKTNKKEIIGNLVMDLRTASFNSKDSKWYGLLNSKFSKHRPELLMAFYVENEAKNLENYDLPSKVPPKTQSQVHKVKETIPITISDNSVTEIKNTYKETKNLDENEDVITPVLNSREGIYQIGPKDIFNENYLFSITLAFAENLSSLSDNSSNTDNEYNFFYTIFGNDVSTEKFKNLSNPNFPVERASVRIKASPEYLAKFFKQLGSFRVTLCRGDTSIAYTELSLKQFSEIDYFSNPKSLEGIFELFRGNESKKTESTKKAAIGVSVSLKKESQDSLLINIDKALSVADFNSNNESRNNSQAVENPKSGETLSQEYSVFFDKSSEHSNITQSNTTVGDSSIQTSYIGRKISKETKDLRPHRFSFTIDLRSFKLEEGVASFKTFFRYNYTFFGTTSPIETRPPIRVSFEEDALIPHGCCSFNIATTPAKLEATFREIPLILEVLELTNADGKELRCLTGIGKLSLDNLIKAGKENYTNEEGKLCHRQTKAIKLPIISLSGPILGRLSIVMTLDEMGLIETPTKVIKDPLKEKEEIPSIDISSQDGSVIKSPKTKILTVNDVLKAALELELWKEQQEILFRQSLKEREADHLQALTAEWKKRDADREIFVRKSLKENQQLEDKLKRALTDVELRERQLSAKENELDRNLKEFLNRVNKTEMEAKDGMRRIKTECDYRLDLEKQKYANLEFEFQKLKERNNDLEKRLGEKEKIIQTVQNKLNGLPEFQLQADITTLHSEKEDLKKKLEMATSAKSRYKEQWGKALRQISALQQQLNTVEKNELEQKVKELEKDKLKETARQEEKKISSERHKLEEIKNEVSQLKLKLSATCQNEENLTPNLPVTTTTTTSSYNPYNFASQTPNSLTNTTSEISSKKDPITFLEGLMNEKQLLLDSGVYKENDLVIKVLDKRIKEALQKQT